jgi:hypothetical protein
MKIKRLHTVRVGPDDDIRIDLIKEDGVPSVIRIGNYVPSLQGDGRGVVFPSDTIDSLMEALRDVQKTYGRHVGVPGEGQLQLDF